MFKLVSMFCLRNVNIFVFVKNQKSTFSVLLKLRRKPRLKKNVTKLKALIPWKYNAKVDEFETIGILALVIAK